MNQNREFPTNYSEKSSNQRLRMAYLDGIRGLAALYVVLVHSCDYNLSVPLEPALLWLALAKFLRYGIFAVVTFIVLSGYCLMLPIVRSNKRYFSGGLLEFFKRRIRRILPPYYAALIFCMLISGLVLWLENEGILGLSKEKFGELQGLFSPTFSFHDLLVYALLIQNLGLHFNKINGPTWTVAVEWQIYFVFAILLIPIWRRLGLWATLGISFVLGLSLKYLMGDEIAFNVCPWFIGLFALGMAAAEINFSKKPSLMRLNKSLPWGVLSIVFASLAFLTEWLRFGRVVGLEQWIVHYFVGLGAACLLIYCTNLLLNGKQLPPLLRLLESPWAVTLGVFSYSLYITHAPVVWLVHQLLLSLNLSPTLMATKWLIIGVPSSLMVAYLFHVAFERPFMSHFSVNIKSQKTKKNISPNSYNGLNASFDGDLTSTETKFSNSLKKLLEWLQDYMSVDTVTLLLPVKDQQDLAVYATLGLEEEIVQKIRIPIGRGFAGRIASSREPMIVNNLSNIEIVSPILREKGLQSLVGIPLPVKQNSIGVLHIGTFKSKQFTERDVKQLKEIANLIESMIADAGSADSELPTRSQENWNKPFVKGPNTYINTLYQFFTSNLETLKARLFTSKYKLVKIFTLLSFVAEPIQLS